MSNVVQSVAHEAEGRRHEPSDMCYTMCASESVSQFSNRFVFHSFVIFIFTKSNPHNTPHVQYSEKFNLFENERERKNAQHFSYSTLL